MPLSQIDPYYRVGTATFAASTAVTGQGTSWLGNVEPGDQIFNQLGQMAVVASVNSDTSITLVAAFAGTVQTAQAYTIYRVPDSVRLENFSQRSVNLLKGGNVQSLSDLLLAANKLIKPDGAGSLTLQDFAQWAQAMLALPGAANKLPFLDNANTAALTDLSAKARALLARTDITGMFEELALNRQLVTDWRSINRNGVYAGNDAANSPGPGFWIGTAVVLDSNWTIVEVTQFTTASAADTKTMQMEKKAGTWGSWYPVLKSRQEMDARYQQLLGFTPVNKAGDTMSGALALGGSLTIGTGGTYAPGSIFAASAWGMIIRALTDAPTSGLFSFRTSANLELLRIALDGGWLSTIAGQTGLFPHFGCRAWAKYNQNTGAVLGSGNISSIVYYGEPGRAQVNLATPMPNANYAAFAINNLDKGGTYDLTPTGFKLWFVDNGPSEVSIAVIG